MGIEASDTISGLNEAWPLALDPKSEGDNHLRLIKHVLKRSFDDAGNVMVISEKLWIGTLPGNVQGIQVDGNVLRLADESVDPAIPQKRLELRYDPNAALPAGQSDIVMDSWDRLGTLVNSWFFTAGLFRLLKGAFQVSGLNLARGIMGLTDATIAEPELSHSVSSSAGAVLNTSKLGKLGLDVATGKLTVEAVETRRPGGTRRARFTSENSAAATTGKAIIESYTEANVLDQLLTVTAEKASLTLPAAPTARTGDITTMGNTAGAHSKVDYAVGTTVWVLNDASQAAANRNQLIQVRLHPTINQAFQQASGGTQLDGTWRALGYLANSGACMAQRIA